MSERDPHRTETVLAEVDAIIAIVAERGIRKLWGALTASHLCGLTRDVRSLLREVEELEKKCKEFREALIWCSGAEDFQEGGKARVGWQKLQDRLLKKPTQEEDQRDG